MLKYIFAAFFVIIALLLKPITTHFIQIYSSELLKQKVTISSLNLSTLDAKAFIADANNTISANIVSIYPLRVKANFRGNIDAFKTFHPLKGYAQADAEIFYDEKLIVKGEVYLYGGNSKVIVKELEKSWLVELDATSLDLKKLQEQNNKEVKIDAKADIKLLFEGENFKLNTTLKSKEFETINIDAKGKLKDANISTSANIAFKDTTLNIDRLKIDTKTLEASLKTSSFGGVMDASFKDGMLYCDAKSLHLTKVLKFLKQEPLARGYLNLSAKLDTKTLDANVLLTSPWLVHNEHRVERVRLKIPDLKYQDKKLKTSYKLDATYMKKHFTFNGDALLGDTVKLNAKSRDFKGKTHLELEDKNLKISMKNIDIKEVLTFASIDSDARGQFNLDAKGDFNKFDFHIDADTKVKEHPIVAKADGIYDIKSKLLVSNIKASVALKKSSFDIDAKATYQKDLNIKAYSSSFASKTVFELKNERFKLNTKELNLQKIASEFDIAKILYGYVNIQASGTFKDIDFKIQGADLRRNFKLKNINDALTINLSGNYNSKLLRVKDDIIIHYEKERIPLKVNFEITPRPPFDAKGSLSYKKDKFLLNSFAYEDEQIKSDFVFDVKSLYRYRALFNNTFHEPFKISAKFRDALEIKTNSLGGELNINLNKSKFFAKLKNIDAKKAAALVAKDEILDSGKINGDATYDIKEKRAKTDFALKNLRLNGIDIDQKISNIEDILGLNVINVSKSVFSSFTDAKKLKTDIEHLEFDISLKNKNINLDDIALSTKKFRIVAIGELKQNGDINALGISFLDKNGCAIVTQDLIGNIKKPTTAKTTSTLVNIAQSVPKSILKTGRGILDFGTKTIDGLASFGLNTILRTDANVSITTDVVSESFSLIDSASTVIMPKGCKVIYDGKVKHP